MFNEDNDTNWGATMISFLIGFLVGKVLFGSIKWVFKFTKWTLINTAHLIKKMVYSTRA